MIESRRTQRYSCPAGLILLIIKSCAEQTELLLNVNDGVGLGTVLSHKNAVSAAQPRFEATINRTLTESFAFAIVYVHVPLCGPLICDPVDEKTVQDAAPFCAKAVELNEELPKVNGAHRATAPLN